MEFVLASFKNALASVSKPASAQRKFFSSIDWHNVYDLVAVGKLLQGCTKRFFPGCVKLNEKVALCLPTAGKTAQFFTSYSHNLIMQPCSCVGLFHHNHYLNTGRFTKQSNSSSTRHILSSRHVCLRDE